MGSSREGSLPRQKWVSVNSAGAFPASQYFLPGLAPWSPGLCACNYCCCSYLALLLPKCCRPTSNKADSFSSLCRTDETGLFVGLWLHHYRE